MSNITFELAHGSPDHANIRTAATRDLLPGEIDYNATSGEPVIADRGATSGKEFGAIVQNGSAVMKVLNPAYDAAGSTAITKNVGVKLYLDRVTPGSAFDADTNPYNVIAWTNSASSIFLGIVADYPVRVTEEYIQFRFDNKAPSALGAAAT